MQCQYAKTKHCLKMRVRTAWKDKRTECKITNSTLYIPETSFSTQNWQKSANQRSREAVIVKSNVHLTSLTSVSIRTKPLYWAPSSPSELHFDDDSTPSGTGATVLARNFVMPLRWKDDLSGNRWLQTIHTRSRSRGYDRISPKFWPGQSPETTDETHMSIQDASVLQNASTFSLRAFSRA
jgi:hypothetical protein